MYDKEYGTSGLRLKQTSSLKKNFAILSEQPMHVSE